MDRLDEFYEWAKDKGHYPVTEAIERWLKMIERHGTG
jgi:hypothetical protein